MMNKEEIWGDLYLALRYGLTVKEPWATCIAEPTYGKDVENREWRPKNDSFWFALHSGQNFDTRSVTKDFFETRYTSKELPYDLAKKNTGKIIAVCHVSKIISDTEEIKELNSIWAHGTYCWVIDKVLPLKEHSFKAKGFHKLWRLTPEQREEICEALTLLNEV